MSETKIRDRLVERGRLLFEARKECVQFTEERGADKLLNDIQRYPHAFVIGCVMMGNPVHAKIAWIIPYRISEKLGDFNFSTLSSLSLQQIQDLMNNPEPLHRFPNKMGENLYQALVTIDERYKRDASRIWKDKPSSAEVVYRFLQFKGVGSKSANMATNILARDFKVSLSDYYSIDISADRHVRQVFHRLGLILKDATVEQIIYKARALNPKFPGLMDLPAWEIGRKWCKPKQPTCENCYMKEVCPIARL